MSQTPFSPEQIELLNQPLDAKRVKHRPGGGNTQLSYLEGHDVINMANQIFGYGQWGYDLLGVELNSITDEKGEVIGGYYAARLRLTVAGCVPITEEGVCAVSEGRNPRAKIDSHDMARKGAITDALKRALRCFGDQFGNSLYNNGLVDGQPSSSRSANRPMPGQAPRPAAPSSAPAPRPAPVAATPAPARPAPAAATAPAPRPAAAPTNGVLPANDKQREGIRRMAAMRKLSEERLNKELSTRYGATLDSLSDADARDFLTVLNNMAA